MMIQTKTTVALFMVLNSVWCFQMQINVPSPVDRTRSTRLKAELKPSIGVANIDESDSSKEVSKPTKREPKITTGDDNGNCESCAEMYLSKTTYEDGTKPASAFSLGTQNFIKQGKSMIVDGLAQVGITSKDYIPPGARPPNCLGLTLDDEAVYEAERRRESQVGGKVETNPIARKLYDIGCFALDELFPDRPIARFWFLETIARMPYFSYVSMLHLYESFGWWRNPQLRKVHNAEEDNELHHLLIMESLGGNALWRDRFLGYHVAIGYYWAICALFFYSPKAAYEFMALLES